MKKLAALLLLPILLFACNKEQISCFTPPEGINFRIVDRNGVDLLNPAFEKGYKLKDISLFYMEDGKKVEIKTGLDSIPDKNIYFLNTGTMSWLADKGRDFSLKLSVTETDNIYLRYDSVSENHCGFYRLIDFIYNDVPIASKAVEGTYVSVYEITR